MKRFRMLLTYVLSFMWLSGYAQEDLLSLLDDSTETKQEALSAFKGSRIISGQSVQTVGGNNLDFLISHRFDRLNLGAYEFFGLDGALIRLGLEYGLTDDLTIGAGRSSYFKTYDGFAKYRFLKQATGGGMPFTAALFASINVSTQKLLPPEVLSGTEKLTYTSQLLLARRFSDAFSLQLSPTYIYRVRPEPSSDEQGIFAIGAGARYKLTKQISLNGEYFYVLPDQISTVYKNCLALGFDIETGGHVFQLHFTNSYGMTERYFITETVDSWEEGDVHFGFNISRTFSFGKTGKQKKDW